jgi:acyl-CoA synthetase (NDP forming)
MTPSFPFRENIKRLLRPRHIAFFGGKAIEEAVRYADEIGFRGETWVVNPNRENMGGRKCFRSVDELPSAPDASFIAVRPEASVEVVRHLAERGSAGAVCYAAGFKEIGARGLLLHKSLLEAAGSMAIVGPNAPGLINFFDRTAVTLDEKGLSCPQKGVAIITQSGSFADNSSRNSRSLPIGYLLSTGNQSMLESADYIDVLLEDARITAIGLHMEGLNDVVKFHDVAVRALHQNVPIVVLKTGTSQKGAEAANSHSAALAGNDELFSALFQRLNIIRARTLIEFIETLKLFTTLGSLKGKRVCVLTCSGFDCSNAADVAETAGVVLPSPSVEQNQDLAKHLTEYTEPTNPLDCAMAMWGDRSRQAACFKIMMRESYDCALLIVTYPIKVYGDVRDWDAAVNAFIDAAAENTIPCVCVSNLAEGLPESVREQLHSHGIAALQGLHEAMFAIKSASDYQERRQAVLRSNHLRHTPIAIGISGGKNHAKNEWHSKKWLNELGVSIPDGLLVSADNVLKAAKEIGFPVVVKVAMDELVHKSEIGGVFVGARDERDVQAAVKQMEKSLQGKQGKNNVQFIVEKYISDGIAELIVGIKRDPRFGLVLILGSGGIFAELISDVVRLILPITPNEVRAAVSELKASVLLKGTRGRPAGDLEAVIDTVMKIVIGAESIGQQLSELDVNPLIVCSKGAVAADAWILLEENKSEPLMSL